MGIKKIFFLSVLLFSSSLTYSQEKAVPVPSIDTNKIGYKNTDALGGPGSVGAQLAYDNRDKESKYRSRIYMLDNWDVYKKKVSDKTGISFGISYTSLYTHSSAIKSDTNLNYSTGGVLIIQSSWKLINKKKNMNLGSLVFKLNSRHAYGDITEPFLHGFKESGYYGSPAMGFNKASFRVMELNWQQNFFNDKLTVVLGKVDLVNYFNFHLLIVPWQGFLGLGGSVSGTINWPKQGLGIVSGVRFKKHFYVIGAITDVAGDGYLDGDLLDLGNKYYKGILFKGLEVGYVKSQAERLFKRVSLTYWNTDGYTTGTRTYPNGHGMAFSAHWLFKSAGLVPFVRFGIGDANGVNAFYKRDIQIGNGFQLKKQDILGISFSNAITKIPNSKSQSTIETFYSFQFTEHMAISPDFQFIFNPATNRNVSMLYYWAVRARVSL